MVYKSLLRGLLPATCLLCGGRPAERWICAPTAPRNSRRSTTPPRCAMPLQDALGTPCGHCLQRAPRFGACIAALRYEHPVRELLSRFKFQGDLAAGRMLAGLLAVRLATLPAARRTALVLVPVPLHPARLRERGFNQSERIARVLAAELGLALSNTLVRRVQRTADQKQLDAAARSRNLQGAFHATGCAGRRIALVDDVITTGATAEAVTAALLAAGAAQVEVWCLARAL
ncbi:MAG: ComF family protein [Gammaproteobacteria bacterium]|nr:ComF family protein [Gammaproteobacteria bacterium]